MFYEKPLTGSHLEDKEICLTFDDGPGNPDLGHAGYSLEIATYLRQHSIPATFFFVGSHILQCRANLDLFRSNGHEIGNHTFSHLRITDFAGMPHEIENEIARTDQLIRNGNEVIPFRAPFGDWGTTVTGRDKLWTPADHLNRTKLGERHVGPIGWDIDGEDWTFWRDSGSAQTCANRYIDAIASKGRGIVLLHDSSFDNEAMRSANGTLNVLKRIVPLLKDCGFRFVSLQTVLSRATKPEAHIGMRQVHVSVPQVIASQTLL